MAPRLVVRLPKSLAVIAEAFGSLGFCQIGNDQKSNDR